MPFGNGKKKYFRGSFQFIIVTIRKISPAWKPELAFSSHFSKLKIAYVIGNNLSNLS